MQSEADIRSKYEAEYQDLDKWGDLVTRVVWDALTAKFPGDRIYEVIQIQPKHRMKSFDSLIGKAFRQSKSYSSPYEEIQDKVGVRFVVLLEKQIDLVKAIIEDPTQPWSFELSRDYAVEKDASPHEFSYHSVHYIVTSLVGNAAGIPEGLPCEVQIRTILQHAHSQLTHARIYKPRFEPKTAQLRTCAQSMALVEVTDQLFTTVDDAMAELEREIKSWLEPVDELYNQLIGDTKILIDFNTAIYDGLQKDGLIPSATELSQFYDSPTGHPLIPLIASLKDTATLATQPIVLIVVYLCAQKLHALWDAWPLSDALLRPLLSKLGISTDRLE